MIVLLFLLSGCTVQQPQPQMSEEELLSLAEMSLDQNRYDEAAQFAKQVVGINDANARAHEILLINYARLQKLDEIKTEINRLLELDPQNVMATEAKRIIEGSAGDKKIKISAEAEAHYAKAEDYFVKSLYAESIEEYKKVIALEPNFARAYLYLGDSYYSMDDFNNAVTWMEKATEIDPTDKRAWHYLGDAYLAVDKKLQAKNAYQKALEIDPGYLVVQKKIEELEQSP